MKNSFVSGALILMIANAVSKILGAVLKIPLTYIMHEEGMAIYNTAFSVYIMLLSLVTSGVPFAVTKLSAGEIANGRQNRSKSIVVYATVILSTAGLVGSFVGQSLFGYWGPTLADMAILPSVLGAIIVIAVVDLFFG